MLRSSKAIREEIANLETEAESILKLAEQEEREFSDDEQSRFDAITGDEGEIFSLRTEEDRAVKREKFQSELSQARKIQNRFDSGELQIGNDGASATGELDRITVPAKARVHGRLTAFSDDHEGEKAAYVAGRILAANLFGDEQSQNWLDKHGITNALSGSDNSGAGVLVPVEMSAAIIRLVEQYGVFRQFASTEPMGSDRKIIPVRVSGMTAYPVAETTTANEGSNTGTQSEPTYKNIEMVARKWKVLVKMSDEVNEDAFVSMADQVAVESALAFAYAEDNAGFNGDGTSTYHGINGILNAVKAGSVKESSSGDTSFGDLILGDFEEMVGMLPDYPGINPRWFITKEGYYASMHRLLMAAGGNTADNLSNGGRPRFLGYDVVFTNVLNKTLSAQTDTKILAFGDLAMGCKFGDRRMMSMSLSDQRFWDEDQIGVKATERFDINVHSTGTATEAGAILVMETPGS